MELDAAIVRLLALNDAKTQVSSHGGSSFSSTSKITTALKDGTTKMYFMKAGSGKDAEIMFKGEHESLNAIHTAVPTLCPSSIGHGAFASKPSTYFLVTDFLDLTRSSSTSSPPTPTLAAKLAKLHTTPAPPPPGHSTPQFGFPATTCCGETPQPNSFNASWPRFFAENRLRAILKRGEAKQGADEELRRLVTATIETVVPALLAEGHLGGEEGVVPVVVHGDLWSGNKGKGRMGADGEVREVVFDPSACYAHSEYELGIMSMFGGFGREFFVDYHGLCPKTEPVEEYEDRVKLYELYHHLNHHAMFGGGYKGGAVSIMKGLLSKYGRKKS